MAHRPNSALRTALAAAAVSIVALVLGAAPVSAEQTGPTMTTYFSVTPDGYPRVGQTLEGNVGEWAGTGELRYELRWELCNPSATVCTTRVAETTDDPTAVLEYTPTAADNFSEGELQYVVTATDSVGSRTVSHGNGRVLPSRRWYNPAGSDIRVETTRAALDPDGVATVVGLWAVQGKWGLYAQRLALGAPLGDFELVFESSRPENDPTRVVALESDGQGRVQMVFVDDRRNLMVTERDPATDAWAVPTQLASPGTFHLGSFASSDGEGLLVAAGDGRAAVGWVSGEDAGNPAEMHVATRGVGGWGAASVHTVDQPREISCGPDYSPVTIAAPTDAELGIDAAGDVTVVWSRFEWSCPGDPYQGYNRLEGAYRRDGAWTSVHQLARTPGFYGNYVPAAMAVSQAGAAVALTRSWFEGDSSNGRQDLRLMTAPSGATFGTIDPDTSAPTTVLRRWADGGEVADDGQLTGGVDLVLSENGMLHVAWGSSGTGVPHTVEIASGTFTSGAGPTSTIASRPSTAGRVGSPRITVDDGGHAAVAFEGAVAGAGSNVQYFALHDPVGGWGHPQTIDTMEAGTSRWSTGEDPEIGFDHSRRLHYLRNGAYGSPLRAALTRLANGSAPPTVEIGGPNQGKAGSTVRLEPTTAADPDGGTLSYAWDLDFDGEYDDATTREVTRPYAAPGRYWVGLKVTASDGDFDLASRFIDVVANSAPTFYGLGWTGDQPVAGQPTSFVAYAGDDFDEASQLTYAWTFDDVLDPAQTGETASRTFTSGWHEVTVTVTDSDGASSSRDLQFMVEGEDPPPTYSLDVTKIGPGTGRVDGQGVSCGTDCGGSYIAGAEVTLVADPADDSVFTGWTGCTEEVDGDCVVVMDEDVEVTAGFDTASSQERTLTVAITGAGSGSVTGPGVDCGSDCTTIVQQGDEVVLTADPGASSKLKGWSGCDSVVDGGRGCAVTMSDDKAVSASFAPRFGSIDTVITSTKVNHAKRKATISFSGSSPADVDHFECKLDAGSWAGCTSSTVLKKLSRGSHTLQVRTVDRDGITDKTPAEVTFKVKRR